MHLIQSNLLSKVMIVRLYGEPMLHSSKFLECDRMFISNPDGPKNGTFASPTLEIPEGHSRQCIYTFIASENERVQVTFTVFNLKGTPTDCNHEYIDLYTEVEEPSKDLITTPFGGRICGNNLPRKRISLYETLVIAFYTDEKQVTPDVFQGIYEFINASQYVVGTPTPNSVCSFTIYSDRAREGEILSPTYPGVYPKNLQCQYRFLGGKGQRVRLEFLDFDLVYGGSHCPFDYVKVFDGLNAEYPLIGTYCGQQRNLVIYSSGDNLYVFFNTMQRTTDSENRGFSGWFEFSERFVKLDFIHQSTGEHIRGTECDQKVLSKKESNGRVYSPNWPLPYHSNTVCKYFIYGLQDTQHLERVALEFEKFDIPIFNPSSSTTVKTTADDPCPDGNVKVYLQGQEERQALDEFDHVFCGHSIPPVLKSEGPRLALIFNSGSIAGVGFKATYRFETDYKVPGTPSPDGRCHFTYNSATQRKGEFNSPRYPANYPSNTTCEYIFQGSENEQVKFVFNYFRLKPEVTDGVCNNDWLEIYEVFPSGRESKIGRYCGKSSPGPVFSDVGVHSMKVVLCTDGEDVASGFSATYNFIDEMSKFGDCGYNISGKETGIVTSPRFPDNYPSTRQVCNWYITVKPNHKVLLFFLYFLIEGDPIERGCSGAVMRIWKNLSQPPIELCGEKINNDTQEIISASSMIKISFVTADKAVGTGGFKVSWTEIKEGECDMFQCKVNRYCISKEMQCNDLPNCGKNDSSDEANCLKPSGVNVYLVTGLSVGGGVLMIMTVCLVCHRKRKRRRHHSPPCPHRQKVPRDVPSMHFVSVDSV
ncbi:tolloid-like protein 2 isoform X3 [Centruroides vittatus]|uniref:tolloid-like protein 2 isoform X3 n=1 Tax=Centruroides vittatus TaxID=120091 RepID=UPI0035100CB7